MNLGVLRAPLLCLAACLLLGGAAWAQGTPPLPPQRPYLRIAAPFHTQVVNRLAQDPTGAVVATASDDKTIRIWKSQTGEALATLRAPIGDGAEGEFYAVAISPDGKTLLAGGQTAAAWDDSFAVYLFDLEGQRLKGRLPNLPASINHIAYAPNGRAFAVALGGGQGIRLFDATTGKIIATDDDGFKERVTWIAFDRTGRFAAASLDGEIRLYDPTGKRVARRTPFAGRPYSLAFNPTAEILAIGYSDQPRVELLSARDLAPRATLTGAKTEPGGFGAVAWGKDDRLFAGGSVRNAASEVIVRSWTGPRAAPVDWPAALDTISQIDPTADGGILISSADPSLVRLRANGSAVFRNASPGIDFRDIAERRFTTSRDGYAITLQARHMAEPITIDMGNRVIAPPAGGTRALTPVAAAPSIRVTNWRNGPSPQVEGRPLKLEAQELSRSYAVAPGQDLVIIGTDYQLRVFRRDGSAVGRGVPLPAAAWGLAVSGDGKVLVAAVGDGTLRWFGIDTNGELSPRLAAFPTADGQRWVAWTPEGQFDHADRGGKELVGVQMNRARGQPPEWFSFAQVYRALYAPDAVTRRLKGEPALPEDTAATLANLRQSLGNQAQAEVDMVAVCWPRPGATRALTPVAAGAPAATDAPPASGPGGDQCNELAASSVARGLRERVDDAEVVLPPGIATTTLRYRVRGEAASANVDVFLNGRSVMRSLPTRGGDAVLPPVPLDPGLNHIQLRVYDAQRQTYVQSRVVQVGRSGTMAEGTPSAMPIPGPATPPAGPEGRVGVASNGTAGNAPSLGNPGSSSPGPGTSGPSTSGTASTPANTQGTGRIAGPAAPTKPRVFVVVAGVDKYRPGIPTLNFAVADARSVGRAIKANAPSSYADVQLTELYDQDATLDRLKAELKRVAAEARPEDTVLIYLSGHGFTIDKHYYFITHNVNGVPGIAQQAFNEVDLVNALSAIRARNGMVFLDTCHAGAFSLDSAAQIAHESGRYVLAGAASLETALDSYDNKQGVFATAVLRGLKGGAAQGKPVVDNFGLGFFVRDLVKQLAEEKRHEQSARFKIATEDAQSFPIVAVAP